MVLEINQIRWRLPASGTFRCLQATEGHSWVTLDRSELQTKHAATTAWFKANIETCDIWTADAPFSLISGCGWRKPPLGEK